MSYYISSLCKSVNFQLRKIGLIRKYLTDEVAKTLITSLVLSRLDYCNSLLGGICIESLNRLQIIQNNAARLVSKTKRYDHITPVLKQLHWLPIKERIIFKHCLLCYKCLNGLAPLYLSDLIHIYHPRKSLRSSCDTTQLQVPIKKYKFYGERSFSFLGPVMWNKIPQNIREATSLYSFKRQLKAFLFHQAYSC